MQHRSPARSGLAVIAVIAAVAAVVATTSAGCGQDDDPEGARVLWDKVNAGAGFASWQRAPGYGVRRASFTAHATAVEIFVSPEVTATLAPPAARTAPVTEWPVGSIVVKEGFSSVTGGSRKSIAIMEKQKDGWFWAEYDDSGTSTYSGHPSVCLDCHTHRKSYSDWVYSFELPR